MMLAALSASFQKIEAQTLESEAAACGEGPQQAKAEKKQERCKNAYNYFCDEQRPAVMESIRRANCGKLPLRELGMKLGALWSQLGRRERLKYQELAAWAREQLQMELDADAEAADPVRALKDKYRHLIPKSPPSAYWIFSQDAVQRARGKAALATLGREASLCNMASAMGELWQDATNEVLADFAVRAKSAGEGYPQKVEAWKLTPEFAEIQNLVKQRRGCKRREALEREVAKRKVHEDSDGEPQAQAGDNTDTPEAELKLTRIKNKRPETEHERSVRARLGGA